MPEIKLTNTKFLRVFADKMMEDKGIPEAERLEMRDDLVRDIDDKIETAILESLPIEKLRELDQLLDDGADDAALDKFFAQLDGNYDEVIERALAKYRENFLQSEEA